MFESVPCTTRPSCFELAVDFGLFGEDRPSPEWTMSTEDATRYHMRVAFNRETKQTLEAAHFVWRCLRHFDPYSRYYDPAPHELLADPNLERILREQTLMTRNSAKLHVDRVRDWGRT